MKDSFTVQLAVKLLLTGLGWPPLIQTILSPFIAWILGEVADRGILKLDLTLDAIKRGMSLAEFKKHAEAAHKHATARIYTPAEKVAIRAQYLDALSRFGSFGNGMRDN